MADKKVIDFVTLEEAKDDDLILVASNSETYNMKVKAIKDAVEGSAQRAEAAAQAAESLASDAKSAANNAASSADLSAQEAENARIQADEAAANADAKAQIAQEAADAAEAAAAEAQTAKSEANTAAELANSKASAAEVAAGQATTAAQAAQEAKAAADTAAEAAQTAAEVARTQGNYAKAQGDRAAQLVDKIEDIEVGNIAADILALQNGKADLINGTVPENQLPKMFYPQLVITSPIGNTLECKCEAHVLTDVSTGNNVFNLPDYGIWEISCTAGSTTHRETIIIDATKQYALTFTGYSAILKNNTWENIGRASEEGIAADLWEIGDEIDIVVNGETLTLQIYGFNHDNLTGGGKAGITFGMKHLMAETRQMNSTNTNAGSFTGSALYSWLENTIFPALPEDLRSLIKPVDKKTSAGQQSTTIKTESMKLFLLSPIENGLRTTTDVYKDEGETYPIFTDNASRIKNLANGAGSAYWWWERSPAVTHSGHFCHVNSGGFANNTNASGSYGVCFGFCI